MRLVEKLMEIAARGGDPYAFWTTEEARDGICPRCQMPHMVMGPVTLHRGHQTPVRTSTCCHCGMLCMDEPEDPATRKRVAGRELSKGDRMHVWFSGTPLEIKSLSPFKSRWFREGDARLARFFGSASELIVKNDDTYTIAIHEGDAHDDTTNH